MDAIDQNTEFAASEKAALFLLEQTMEYAYPAALRTAALLDIADHLADGPKPLEALARTTGTDELKLRRVLRLLASRGVFQEDEAGRFALTTPAEMLRRDVPLSLRGAVLMITDETFWRPSGEVVESLRGNPPFKKIFGKPFFEYWAEDGAPVEDFHVGMASMSAIENEFLVRSYDFPAGATVVDVAGGFGGLLLRVLKDNPTLHGTLFDQPHVLSRHCLHELGDESRWDLASGDFFQSCPRGDVYILKYIMHDWDDERATRILRSCREAMSPGGRVLVMDPVLPPGNAPHTGRVMDVICMAIYEGGRERTEEELRRLLAGADLRLTRVIDTGCHVSITEAVAC